MRLFRKRLPRSSRRVRKKRHFFLVYFSVLIFSLTALVGSIAWVAHEPAIRISQIVIDGAETLTERELKENITPQISGHYIKLFPKSNIFLYPRSDIRKGLLATFPEIESVSLSFDGITRLIVKIKERVPFVLWCGEDAPVKNASSPPPCYFLDKDGVIFMKAPSFSTQIFFEIYGVPRGVAVREDTMYSFPLGFQFLNEKRFRELMTFKTSFDNIGITPKKLFAQKDGDYEFVLGNGVRVLFPNDFAIDVLLKNLDASFDTELLQFEDLTDEKTSLEYIDLRFKNRVYYK